MSNTRKGRRPKVPPTVAATAAAARCSDCPGRATVHRDAGEWRITMHHAAGCPALRGMGGLLHRDAAKAVSAASERVNVALGYEPDGDREGVVLSGVVTAALN